MLTIQAFPSLTLPASGNPASPPQITGYFHTWEDYALFVLFIVFTCVAFPSFFFFFVTDPYRTNLNNSLEAFARICVNGFLLDPQVSIFTSSSSPLRHESYIPTPGGVGPSHPAGATGTGMTEMARQTTLTRGHTLTQTLRRFQRSLLRPFALPTRAPPSLSHSATGGAGYLYELTPVVGGFSTAAFDNGHPNTNLNDINGITIADLNGQTQASSYHIHHPDTNLTSRVANGTHRTHTREPSEPSYLSRAMKSDASPLTETNNLNPKGLQTDALSLPFHLSISHMHSKTQRNVPYLRQSWTRIDFLAIVSFWIMFGLATAGLEHGAGGIHIGVFRAISVIRTARLLTVTSGTTVSLL